MLFSRGQQDHQTKSSYFHFQYCMEFISESERIYIKQALSPLHYTLCDLTPTSMHTSNSSSEEQDKASQNRVKKLFPIVWSNTAWASLTRFFNNWFKSLQLGRWNCSIWLKILILPKHLSSRDKTSLTIMIIIVFTLQRPWICTGFFLKKRNKRFSYLTKSV